MIKKRNRSEARRIKNKNIAAKIHLKEKDIALIIREGWTVVARNSFDVYVDWAYTSIESSMKVVPLTHYIQVRSNCIVRADLIKSISQIDRKLSVTLKDPFKKKVIVPREKISAFKAFGEKYNMEWWDPDKKRFR